MAKIADNLSKGRYTALKYAPIISKLGRGKLDTEIKQAYNNDLAKVDNELKKVFNNLKIGLHVSDSVYNF